jgi:uncharacterized phage protein (TIGR02220 family)
MNSGFIENWKNGQKGGRPRKTSREPVDNQLVTQSVTSQEPNGNHLASQSDQTRQDLTKQNSEGGSKGEDHVEKPEAPKPPGLRWDLAKELVDHLNQQTGGAFLASSAVLDAVANRLLETKQDVPGVKQMITRQAAIWGKDERMRPFLRPLTLFDEQKFHDYYGQRALPLPDKKAASDPALRRKQLEELIEKSPANRESAYHRADVSDADKQKLRGWRRELAAL